MILFFAHSETLQIKFMNILISETIDIFQSSYKVIELQDGAKTVEGEMIISADKQLIFKRIPITTTGTRLQAKLVQ